jgi:hypothetical protein
VRIVKILLWETKGNLGSFKSPVFKIGDFSLGRKIILLWGEMKIWVFHVGNHRGGAEKGIKAILPKFDP